LTAILATLTVIMRTIKDNYSLALLDYNIINIINDKHHHNGLTTLTLRSSMRYKRYHVLQTGGAITMYVSWYYFWHLLVDTRVSLLDVTT
jgi:hypothetical protein